MKWPLHAPTLSPMAAVIAGPPCPRRVARGTPHYRGPLPLR
jgi:hypothetical protein